MAMVPPALADTSVPSHSPADVISAPVASASSTPTASASSSSGLNIMSAPSFYDVRIAVVGNVDSGKSTLIGVLTGGAMDNGRGLARARVFAHKHEADSGRTSAISQHIVGYTADLIPVYNTSTAAASSLMKTRSWTHVVTHSAHIITLIDLAGHEKYLKTTIAGLTGCFPDYALVVINSLAGITKMTKEHLGVVLALNIPLLCVVSKVDMAPDNVLSRTKSQLFRVLKSAAANYKMPMQIKSPADVATVVSSGSDRVCPVFFVSSVNGVHIALLHDYLSRLPPARNEWLNHIQRTAQSAAAAAPQAALSSSDESAGSGGGCEYVIDETFLVSGVGVVVSGTIAVGTMNANSTLLLGPFSDGSFRSVIVRSLHCKRMAVDSVGAGDSCAASIRAIGRKEHLTRQNIRRGMCLVDPILQPHATTLFDADVHILHHPTTIKVGYQAVIHAGMIRQAATIISIQITNTAPTIQPTAVATSDIVDTNNDTVAPVTSDTGGTQVSSCLRTGDSALCRFRFLLHPELLHKEIPFIFREGSTKGIGRVKRTQFTKEEIAHSTSQHATHNSQHHSHQHQSAHTANHQPNTPSAANITTAPTITVTSVPTQRAVK